MMSSKAGQFTKGLTAEYADIAKDDYNASMSK